MKIELISQEQFNRIVEIQEKHPLLTYQQKGYDYPDKSEWSEEDLTVYDEVTEILKKHIVGFSSFTNFNFKGETGTRLRFEYNYGAEDNTMYFIGVGYISLRELHNGFD
jgi:hypothetical protein